MFQKAFHDRGRKPTSSCSCLPGICQRERRATDLHNRSTTAVGSFSGTPVNEEGELLHRPSQTGEGRAPLCSPNCQSRIVYPVFCPGCSRARWDQHAVSQEACPRRYSRPAAWSACRWNKWAGCHHIAVAVHRMNRRHDIRNERRVHLLLTAGGTGSIQGMVRARASRMTYRHGRHASPRRKAKGCEPRVLGS